MEEIRNPELFLLAALTLVVIFAIWAIYDLRFDKLEKDLARLLGLSINQVRANYTYSPNDETQKRITLRQLTAMVKYYKENN